MDSVARGRQPRHLCQHPLEHPLLALAFGAAAALAEIYYVQTRRIARMLDRTSDKLNHVQTDRFLSARPVTIPLDENDPVLGKPSAEAAPDAAGPGRPVPRHTAVIFSDFTCSTCEQMHRIANVLCQRFGDSLKIVHKDFPLNRACNPARRNSPFPDEPAACQAAAAAEAAHRLGGNAAFARMSSLLYENQHLLTRMPYEAFARQIGLNAEAFKYLCDDCQVREEVLKDATLGESLGVRGTPAVFLDGRLLSNPVIQRGPEVLLQETANHWQHLLALLDRYARRHSQRGTRRRQEDTEGRGR